MNTSSAALSQIQELSLTLTPWPGTKPGEDIFKALSQVYSLTPLISLGLMRLVRKRFFKSFEFQNATQILDLMTGTGDNLEYLLQSNTKAHVVALDSCPDMLHMARKKYGTFERINFLHADALGSDLPRTAFDFIFCTLGLKTLTAAQTMRLAAECRRLLKPQGQLAVWELSCPKSPALRRFLNFYLQKIVPGIARSCGKSPEAFRPLASFIRNFESIASCVPQFQKAGFGIKTFNWYGGLISGFWATKL